MFVSTIEFGFGITGKEDGNEAKFVKAACASGKPFPWSNLVKPGATMDGFPEPMIAFRICAAGAAGNACRSTAATPATSGALKLVPLMTSTLVGELYP